MRGGKKYFSATIVAIVLAALFAAYEVISFSRALGAPYAENTFFRGETIAYPASAEISDPSLEIPALGFSPGTSEINFGIVPGGGNYATKYIDIANRGNAGVFMLFWAEGNISGMVDFGSNRILLKPGDSVNMPVKLQTPKSGGIGNYSGTIFVSRVMAKGPVLSAFLWIL